MEIVPVDIEDESKERYLTYALSVVKSRAIPDIRDGLKPVQRRLIYDMYRHTKVLPSKAHKKSAAIVGGVLGRLHPHGESACYDALVRMAQSFNMRYPLVDGQGNFGSIDGDSAAALRYTEARLSEYALEVIGDIDEDTVDFIDNFDGTLKEPAILPSKVPNLLLNGAMGIAVGMATSIPPHNLREVIDAVIALIKDPKIEDDKLADIVNAPDFPTGCVVANTRKELRDIYKTGKGAIKMVAEWSLESNGKRGTRVIISSVPYNVQKAHIVSKIAELITSGRVPHFQAVRDESTYDVRIVLECSKGMDPAVGMAYLLKHTPLSTNFNVNMKALVDVEGTSVPMEVNLRKILGCFLDFRRGVIKRRLRFNIKNLEERVHILEGFVIILADINSVIRIVKRSEGRGDACEKLKKHFNITTKQAEAIVDLRIHQLSKKDAIAIKTELAEKKKELAQLKNVLKSEKKQNKIIIDELTEIRKKFGDKRRSKVVLRYKERDVREEDYVHQQEIKVILTKDGWIKAIKASNDVRGIRLREGDRIVDVFEATTLSRFLVITNMGYAYILKGSDPPMTSGYGVPIQSLFKFRDGEQAVRILSLKDEENGSNVSVLMISRRGLVSLGSLQVDNIRKNGRRISKIRKKDAIVGAFKESELKRGYVIIATRKGVIYKVPVKDMLHAEHHNTTKQTVVKLERDDQIVEAVVTASNGNITLITEKEQFVTLPLKKIPRCVNGQGNKPIHGEIKGIEIGT